jgi:hypothetical protein
MHNHCRKKINYFLTVFFQFGTKTLLFPVRLSENYSNEAHLSAIAATIEFSKTLQETESQFDHDSSGSNNDYGHVQNPTRAMIVSNNFLKALPDCPTIHWPSQTFKDHQLCVCPFSTNTKL